MVWIHIELMSVDEDYGLITWVNGSQLIQGGGTPLKNLVATCHREESASHHLSIGMISHSNMPLGTCMNFDSVQAACL